MSCAFDEEALLERVDGDIEFLEETVAMLDEDSPALLEAIRAAVRSSDAAALVKAAHALKGMLANFCAEPAAAAARFASSERFSPVHRRSSFISNRPSRSSSCSPRCPSPGCRSGGRPRVVRRRRDTSPRLVRVRSMTF